MKKNMIGRLVAIGLLAAGLFVVATIFIDTRHENTDDAQVEQYISPIHVRVSGYIKEIRFTEHQFVRKGDTLLVIDDSEYSLALKQAEAALMDAQSGRKAMNNTLSTATNTATVYDSSIREAELRVEKLRRDYERYSALLSKKATTPVVVEQYQTELEMAETRVAALKRQREAARSSAGEVSQRQENAEAAILRAEAAVDLAKLHLSYTVVVSPADGFLGRRAIEHGQWIAAGQAVTTLVPDGRKWIIANFKETQMAGIREGNKADIRIDALPDKHFSGTVTAISSATGSKYSMVPTDNSAGNFVKIQQRIPVRIDFSDEISLEDYRRMAAGMMCEVKIEKTLH